MLTSILPHLSSSILALRLHSSNPIQYMVWLHFRVFSFSLPRAWAPNDSSSLHPLMLDLALPLLVMLDLNYALTCTIQLFLTFVFSQRSPKSLLMLFEEQYGSCARLYCIMTIAPNASFIISHPKFRSLVRKPFLN